MRNLTKKVKRNQYLILMFLPLLIYYIIFCYLPMGGLVISFQDYFPGRGILGSEWVGLKHFKDFISSMFFGRLVKNTFLISLYSILWCFPIPIIFAVFLMEVRNRKARKFVQTVSYLPHFISLVVVVGMVIDIFSTNGGIVNSVVVALGGKQIDFLNSDQYFRSIYVATDVWESFGWDAIVYIAAISGISPDLYEAADMDGATRFQKAFYITLPQLLPTMTILLLLKMGNLFTVGYEKMLLMYNPSIYNVADIISTYTYRRGILNNDLSFATAVGLFNSVINFAFLTVFNKLAKKFTDISLW